MLVRPSHPLASRRHVTIAEFGRENVIAHNEASPARERVLRLFEQRHAPLNIQIALPSLDGIKRAVEMGLGVALLPRRCALSELSRGQLVARAGRADPPAAAAFALCIASARSCRTPRRRFSRRRTRDRARMPRRRRRRRTTRSSSAVADAGKGPRSLRAEAYRQQPCGHRLRPARSRRAAARSRPSRPLINASCAAAGSVGIDPVAVRGLGRRLRRCRRRAGSRDRLDGSRSARRVGR